MKKFIIISCVVVLLIFAGNIAYYNLGIYIDLNPNTPVTTYYQERCIWALLSRRNSTIINLCVMVSKHSHKQNSSEIAEIPVYTFGLSYKYVVMLCKSRGNRDSITGNKLNRWKGFSWLNYSGLCNVIMCFIFKNAMES